VNIDLAGKDQRIAIVGGGVQLLDTQKPEYQVSRARAVEEIFHYSNVTPFYHCPALPISMLM